MSRLLIFIYGLFSYAVGVGGLAWFALFIGGWEFLPRHIDSETPGPLGTALLINAGLMAIFVLQHSIMARLAFKSRWTKIIPPAAERSTYLLVSGILMALFCLYWQPIGGGFLWQVENPTGKAILIAIYAIGWSVPVVASFMINHFELFGLQQVYFNLINKPEPSPHFTERWFYKFVRHPIQLGTLIGIWATPAMSMTHLLLAATLTIYVLFAISYEEKDLVTTLGKDYEDYQKRVRMIIPLPK
jgi:protein-S-isoprenylcysteine O-methyltransferase Ste14